MKDFIKWLGVNEKVAKVTVWLLIIMVFLIVTNTMLDSMGFPNYKITYDNLVKIKVNIVVEYIIAFLIAFLNFYSIVLLVFRVKDAKSILKYALLFVLISAAITWIVPYFVLQVVILLYIIVFCYLYSGKKVKYAIYGGLASIGTAVIQGIWYMSKAKFINYGELNNITKSILSLDYFIIMGIIILVKEIYLKKRSEKDARDARMLVLDRGLQKGRKVRKETSKKSSKSSKISKK